MSQTKQVIVMRTDLGMRKGKMVAQGAHASMKVLLDRSSRGDMGYDPLTGCEDGTPKERLSLDMTPALREWIRGRFTKICVGVGSEQELLDIYKAAMDAGLLCALIQDAGLTEFDGVPTLTCCAIGPDFSEKIDPITGKLKLL
jgi:peptidyl-tRNA hydrolase, PTH2 family